MIKPEYPVTVRFIDEDGTDEFTIIAKDEESLITSVEEFDSRTDGKVIDALGRPVDFEIDLLEIKRLYVIEHYEMKRHIARQIQGYLNGDVSRQTLLHECRELPQDELISQLVHLVNHEPQRSGCLLLINLIRWKAYEAKLRNLILALQQ